MRRAAREAGFFLVCALAIAWVPGCRGTSGDRPRPPEPSSTTVAAPIGHRTPPTPYTGPQAVCEVGGHRVVTDPQTAAKAGWECS